MNPWRVVAPALLLVLGLASVIMALGFSVAFPTDPLGPRALPWLAGSLLVLAGGRSAMTSLAERPEAPGGRPGGAASVASAVLIFTLFGLLIEPAGYIVATTLAFGAMARLFGGRLGPGLAAGLTFAVLTFFLFVQLLGLALPQGALFAGIGV